MSAQSVEVVASTGGDGQPLGAPVIKETANKLQQRVAGAIGRGVGSRLDPSPWSIVHGTPQSSDNTPVRQPTNNDLTVYSTMDKVDDNVDGVYTGQLFSGVMAGQNSALSESMATLRGFSVSNANPVSIITQRINDKEQILWTSTIGNVLAFRHRHGDPQLHKLACFNMPPNFRFHGSYAFVASNGTSSGFFSSVNNAIARYALVGDDATGFTIKQTGSLALPISLLSDHVVGVTLLKDGTTVASSKFGIVMAARLDADGDFVLLDTLNLADFAKAQPCIVSNSISSIDQGVFIATQREIARVDLDSTTGKLSFKWSTVYGSTQPWLMARLGPGSGSTPTITECGGQRMVTITDGAVPMNLLYFDTETGNMIVKKKVQFLEDENGNQDTTSEQSVAVDGCKAFVVNNYMGVDRLDDNIRCAAVFSRRDRLRDRLPEFCNTMPRGANTADLFGVKACPVTFGCSADGAALFEVQPKVKNADGLMNVKRLWTRPDVSCGTSIPLISTHEESRVAYCAGLMSNRDRWALIGLNTTDGSDVVSFEFYPDSNSKNALANPFYAGVEAVGDREVVIGSIGGVIYVSPKNFAKASAKSERRLMTTEDTDDQVVMNVTDVIVPIVGGVLVALLTLFFIARRMRHKKKPLAAPGSPGSPPGNHA